MANKVKITDGQGTQVFPITHVSAVIDNNGNSVEQVLGAQTNLINQKQLEIGAVPSDLTPTAGSTNWVTSGGVKSYVDSAITCTTQDDSSSSNLNISDTSGNVIAEFSDGEIRSKKQDSRLSTQLMNDDSNSDLNISDPLGNVILSINNGIISTHHSDNNDADSTNTFLAAMRDKAAKMGLSITINGPAGFPDLQTSDAKSMAKLYAVASGYKELAVIWNQQSDIQIYSKGKIQTSHLLHSTVFGDNDGQNHWSSSLTNYYTMLGGKTGTWGDPAYNILGAIIKGPGDSMLVGWVRRDPGENHSSNRWATMKTLMDIAFAKIENPSADVTSLQQSLISGKCIAAQVLKLPSTNIINYETFNFYNEDTRYESYNIYGYQNNVLGPIASSTKVLTAITALDNISELNAIVTIKSSDLIGGGTSASPEFVAGEMFTVRELLYAMMMPSSNTAARALARYVGNILIDNRFKG